MVSISLVFPPCLYIKYIDFYITPIWAFWSHSLLIISFILIYKYSSSRSPLSIPIHVAEYFTAFISGFFPPARSKGEFKRAKLWLRKPKPTYFLTFSIEMGSRSKTWNEGRRTLIPSERTALGLVSSLSPLLPGARPPTFGLVYLINWLAYPNLLPQGLAEQTFLDRIESPWVQAFRLGIAYIAAYTSFSPILVLLVCWDFPLQFFIFLLPKVGHSSEFHLFYLFSRFGHFYHKKIII